MSLEGEASETLEAPAQSEATETTTTPEGFGDQAEALEQRLGGAEATEAEPEGLADDASFVDYLSQQGEEQQGAEPTTTTEHQPATTADGEEDVMDVLDAYLDAALEERLTPIQEQIRNEKREGELKALAGKYPDLKSHEMIDAIGDRLGKLADAYGDPSLRTDPQLVEMAYQAEKAARIAASETPAQPGTSTLERGAASAPDSGETEEQAIQRAVVGAGGGNADLW